MLQHGFLDDWTLLGSHLAGQRVAGDAGVATGVECAAGTGGGGGSCGGGKVAWNRLGRSD